MALRFPELRVPPSAWVVWALAAGLGAWAGPKMAAAGRTQRVAATIQASFDTIPEASAARPAHVDTSGVVRQRWSLAQDQAISTLAAEESIALQGAFPPRNEIAFRMFLPDARFEWVGGRVRHPVVGVLPWRYPPVLINTMAVFTGPAGAEIEIRPAGMAWLEAAVDRQPVPVDREKNRLAFTATGKAQAVEMRIANPSHRSISMGYRVAGDRDWMLWGRDGPRTRFADARTAARR